MEKILPLRFFILFLLILSQYTITAQPNTLTISGTALIKQNLYLDDALILGQRSLPADPGSVNYDPLKGTMNVRNIFAGSSIQVGQEQVKFVINNTSSTILSGSVVAISGYDDVADAFEIKKSLANSVDNARVDGIVTTSMNPGEKGLITTFGRVNDLDTSSFSAGEKLYLSETVSGTFSNTIPPVAIRVAIAGKINSSDGFIDVGIDYLTPEIFGQFSHTDDQVFVNDISTPILFNTNDQISGISHSETTNNSEFTFLSSGIYQATIEPQYTRSSGSGVAVLNIFYAINTGSGFVNVPDSNVKFAINKAKVTQVSPLTATFKVNVGDKIRFMAQTTDNQMFLDSFPVSGTPPNELPLTPSVIMNLVRVGD